MSNLKGKISDFKSLVDATLDVGIQQSLFIREKKMINLTSHVGESVVYVNDRGKKNEKNFLWSYVFFF